MRKYSFIVLWLIGASCTPSNSNENQNSQQFEAVTGEFKNLSGDKFTINFHPDTVVMVNYWATWCKPCLAEMPSLAELQRIMKNLPFKLYLVSDESIEKIETFKQSKNYDFNYLLLVGGVQSRGITSLPTTIIYKKGGEMATSEIGMRNWASPQTIDMINALVNEK